MNPAKEPPTYPEYVTADLRLTITRGTQTIVDQSLNYNVGVDTGAAFPPGHNPLAYAALGENFQDALIGTDQPKSISRRKWLS